MPCDIFCAPPPTIVPPLGIGAIHEPCGLFMCTFETPNVTAVIGRNFSSVLSEDDFSLERLGQVVLSVRKVHAGGGIRSAKVDIRHIDPSRCATPRHRTRAHFSSSALGESPNCHFAFAGETAGFCPHHFVYASRRAKTDVARSSLTKFMRVEIHLQHTIVCGSSCNHHSLSPRLLYQFKDG